MQFSPRASPSQLAQLLACPTLSPSLSSSLLTFCLCLLLVSSFSYHYHFLSSEELRILLFHRRSHHPHRRILIYQSIAAHCSPAHPSDPRKSRRFPFHLTEPTFSVKRSLDCSCIGQTSTPPKPNPSRSWRYFRPADILVVLQDRHMVDTPNTDRILHVLFFNPVVISTHVWSF